MKSMKKFVNYDTKTSDKTDILGAR